MNNNSGKRSEADESLWRVFRDRFEVGQLVEGIVVKHAPFGVFVDIGNPLFPALAEWFHNDLRTVSRPAIGYLLRAVVIDLSNAERRQMRLWVHPSALRAADALQQTGVLPPEEREAFLLQALSSQEPDIPSAVVWSVRYLPLHERGTFLRQALTHWDTAVAAQAAGRVLDLPKEERATFLRLVVQHEDQGVAALAVWMAKHLSMPERRLFLQEAVQHPFPEVNAQARFELGRLPLEE